VEKGPFCEIIYQRGVAMAEGHVCGQYIAHEWGVWGEIFEIWIPEMSFPAFWASKFAPKFMLTILVFEINKGKNAQKV
jgi:hypothetical protein